MTIASSAELVGLCWVGWSRRGGSCESVGAYGICCLALLSSACDVEICLSDDQPYLQRLFPLKGAPSGSC